MNKALTLFFTLLAGTALALPQGGTVTSGASTINQNGNTLNITQGTQNSVLNWQGFNIGSGETVNFYQPNSTALSINRISGNATQIEGALNANGRVWLLNPNGVMFGQGAQVNVGGLLATTASDVDSDGNLTGVNAGSSVINNGTISAGQYAALAAASVQNNGHITAPTVGLVGAKGFALDGSGVLSIAPGLADFGTRVTNADAITAPGGKVQLLAQSTLQQAGLASVVNNSGVVEASGVNTDGGVITLTGDTVNQTGALNANAGTNGNGGTVTVYGNTYTNMEGSIEARGGSQSGNGGNVEVSSKQGMSLTGNVDTTAAHGKTGKLIIDPDNITITDGSGGANDSEVGGVDGTVAVGDGAGTDFIISEQALEALAATTDILLQATSNITVQPLTDHVLALATTGSVGFEAGGNFSMDAADTITTGGATIHIQGTNITVGGLSGGAVTLDTTGGNITIGQGITTANAAITLNGNLILPNDITLASGGGAISLNGNVTGAHALSLNSGSGLTTLQNLDIGTLALSGGGAVQLNGTVTTDNALNLTGAGALTLAGDTTLNATDGVTRQNITLGSANTITGAHNLAITGANVALGGAASGLTSLNADANGTLSVAAAQTTGNQTYTGSGGITLDGNLTTAGGNIAVNNAATLGADTALATSGGNINFTNTINGAHSLTATAGAGSIVLGGAVGAATKLTSINASGVALTLNGVQTTGGQIYTGPATIQGTFVNQTGTASFANNVTLGADTTFADNGTSGNLNIGGTVNGAHVLTVNTGTGAATFTGDVGTGTALTAFNASGNTGVQNVTTSGLQSYSGNTTFNGTETAGTTLNLSGNATLAGNTTLASGGNMSVGGSVTGAHTLTLNANSSDITLNALTAPQLVLAGGNNLNINGNLTTTSGLDFTNINAINLLTDSTVNAGTTLQTGSAALNGNGHNLTVDGTLLTLNAINNVNALTLNGTGITLNSDVVTTGTQAYTGPLTLGGNLTTTGGNVTFNNAVTLAADSTIATGGGNVAVHAAVDGGHNLTITAGSGNVTADNDWGALTRLTTLTATGQTLTFQNINTTGNITLTGAVVSNRVLNTTNDIIIHGPITLDDDLIAGGSILLDGPITLTADSHVNTGGLVGNNLTISGDINGAHNLTLDAGLADIALTGNVDVNSLSFANANQLTYGGGTLHTAQAFDFGNIPTIYLGDDTTIHAGAGTTGRANVTASANNTLLASAPGVDLNIFGDLVTLNQVGDNGGGRLQTLYVDANTVQLLGTIHTVGAQTINATQGLAGLLISNGGDITLNTASTLLTDVTVQSNGGNVYFNKPVDGAHTLMVDAGGGDIYINAALGDGVPLSSFDATGRRIVLAGNLSVSDGLTLNVPVTLAADSTLDSLGSALILNGTIEGAHTLTVNASGGDITLAQGGHVAQYVQGSPSGNVTWGGSGLTVDGDVFAEQMNTLGGKLTTTGQAWLQVNRGTNLALNIGNLHYAGGPAQFSGTVGGSGGQRGAQRVQLGRVVAGSLTLNGMYGLPLPETYLHAPAAFAAVPGPGDATGLYNVNLPPLLADNTVTVE